MIHELQIEEMIKIQDGKIVFEAAVTKIPKNMTTLVMSRVDRIDPDSQLLLRVASVLGKRGGESERKKERSEGEEGEGERKRIF